MSKTFSVVCDRCGETIAKDEDREPIPGVDDAALYRTVELKAGYMYSKRLDVCLSCLSAAGLKPTEKNTVTSTVNDGDAQKILTDFAHLIMNQLEGRA